MDQAGNGRRQTFRGGIPTAAEREKELIFIMETKHYTTMQLFKRFSPYLYKYKGTLIMDLFCAALTTVCELVLPLIMRYITNEGIRIWRRFPSRPSADWDFCISVCVL